MILYNYKRNNRFVNNVVLASCFIRPTNYVTFKSTGFETFLK